MAARRRIEKKNNPNLVLVAKMEKESDCNCKSRELLAP